MTKKKRKSKFALDNHDYEMIQHLQKAMEEQRKYFAYSYNLMNENWSYFSDNELLEIYRVENVVNASSLKAEIEKRSSPLYKLLYGK